LPGPTLNTLGSSGKQPLIQIAGHRTYPTSGHLNLVTVSYIGGPGSRFNVFAALRAWLSPHEAVVPQEEIFTPGQTQQQVTKQDTEEMTNSQQAAQVAALCQLKIDFSVIDTVVSTTAGMPADGLLRRGDVIKAVDGVPVTCTANSSALIKRHPPGTRLTLTVARDGATRTVRVATRKIGGQAVIGVSIREGFRFPFTVKINISNIGGPSAGLMFALGIVDKLTPGDLSGGRFVAGPGVETNGNRPGSASSRRCGQAVSPPCLTPGNCPDAPRGARRDAPDQGQQPAWRADARPPGLGRPVLAADARNAVATWLAWSRCFPDER
jgi:PDZ domain-containing protein